MMISFISILTFYMEKDDCSTPTSSQVAIVHSIQVLYFIPTIFCGRVVSEAIDEKISPFHQMLTYFLALILEISLCGTSIVNDSNNVYMTILAWCSDDMTYGVLHI